jgi:hypothetical protein
MLPLVAIVALMVFGLIIVITALAYDPPPKSVTPRERTSTRELQPQPKLTPRMRAIALRDEWWPRLRYHAREGQLHGLSLESETGPLIAVTVVSVVLGYLVVTFA